MTKHKSKIFLTLLLLIFTAIFGIFLSASAKPASAASFSSGRYRLDIDLVYQVTINTARDFEVYLSGSTSSTSVSGTISEGDVLKFSPKKLEIVIPYGSANQWHTQHARIFNVKLSGPTAFSAPNYIEGTTSENVTASFTLPDLSDGSYTLRFESQIYYRANNSGGWRDADTTTFNFKVDRSAPTISGASTSTTGKYTNKAFTVTATDAGSGVSALYMKSPSSSSYTKVSTSKTVAASSTNGLYRFYAEDNVGNKSSTYYVYLDTVAPSGTFSLTNGNTIASGGSTKEAFSFSATDSGSGVSKIEYKTPGSSTWQNYTTGTVIQPTSTQGLYSFRATDKSGNISTYMMTVADSCVNGHSYTSKVTPPTCTSGGYTTYTCSKCGSSYRSNITQALGHSYKATTTTGSCTEGGYTIYTCTRCGDSYKDDSTAALGHNYSAVVTSPTCTSSGYTTYTCTKCGSSYTGNRTAALGHSYTATTTSSSCVDGGYTTYKCTRCGVSYTDSPTQATGHSYVASITEPTCTERGYTIFTCTKCGDSYRDNETAALGHNYVMETTSATCTESGGTVYICTRCGEKYNGSQTAPLGHVYVSETVAATCEEGGYTLHTCSRCGDSYRDNQSQPLGHNFVSVTEEATCTEYGKTVYTCQVCGYEEEVPDGVYPTGHNYSNFIVKAATCTQDGERRYVCDKCGDEYTEVIPAMGHNYAITDTSSENGITTRVYTCTVCGDSYSQELGDQYEEVSSYVEELFETYSPYMWWVFLATTAIWSIVMGVFFAIAQKNEDKEKAKKMIVNYFIGLVVIFAILVACPYLIRGIAALIT